jgi:hypothetical protein
MKPGMKSCPYFGKWTVGLAVALLLAARAAAQETKAEEALGLLNLAHSEEPGLKDRSVCHAFEDRRAGKSVTKDMR